MTPLADGPVGVVVALPDEVRPILRRSSLRRAGPGVWHGRVGGQRVVLKLSGLGTRCAAEAATWLVERHHCRGLLSPGLAGALEPELGVGQVVVIEEARRPGYEPLAATAEWLAATVGLGARRGVALTLIVPVPTPDQKAALRVRTGAAVVDMETHAVASVAARHRLPWLGLRAISDTASDTIPAPVHRRIDPLAGRIATGHLIGETLPRPGRWPELIALAKRSRRATERLAEAVAAFLESLA